MTKRRTNPDTLLPPQFAAWFASRGWSPRAHQLELLARAKAGESALLIAPTGAGKTLAGFLPTLTELAASPANMRGLHTLYISPLKALAVDVARNLETPISEIGLKIRAETRTGDTPASKRQRQRHLPPDILLTTPEQLTLLLGSADGEHLFAGLRRVVLDELHAIVTSKRGDLLSLALARLRSLAPAMTSIGLSATVRDPDELRRYLVGQRPESAGALRKKAAMAALVTAPEGARADIRMLDTKERLPWSGHSAMHAMHEIYAAIKQARMTLVFVNTRAQSEAVFQQLWSINDDSLPIALHHGSLDAGQRRRVEEAMVQGRLKAVVCTSTLDLGIDWGDVDLVVNVGAPKGASRIAQRIGRANHRLDEPSRAVLVPANRFEVLECRAAIEAAREGAQDTPLPRAGALDVLCQHILGIACAAPFDADALYAEIVAAEPYAGLSRKDFDDAIQFVATGGYALGTYDRFAKIRQRNDGLWRIANPRVAQSWRMNVGTIVESDELKVRLVRARRIAASIAAQEGASMRTRTGALFYPAKLAGGAADASKGYTGAVGRGGRVLGKIEEYFLETLAPGDTFLFGGEVLALQAIVENEALVVRAPGDEPKVPSYAGGKFPLSTYLAERVRKMLSNPKGWSALPDQVAEWLGLQKHFSTLPPQRGMLVETFPRGERHFLVAYPFEGRLAHQTLGMLLTRRMERLGLKPQGFVANDYALAVWSLADAGGQAKSGKLSMQALFAQDMLGDDLEEWLQESALMKRTFRNCAIIAGLIERRFPGKEKSSRQVTISTDLVYDVLRRHEPDHILLRAARSDAMTGLLDLERLAAMLSRIAGRIVHKHLERISPLAVPVMLEIGREPVAGAAQDRILAEAAEDLVEEAMGVVGSHSI
ncbi:MAG: ligase-associated DNA damage response DEXH box helicase [Beijerinckiaceae bacterium]